MKCDVTKVTYNMYLYDTCCMSREMMGTDGRDRVTCQNLEEGTQMELLELLSEIGQNSQ